MNLHYFGHAAVGLEAGDGTRLIVDPYERGGLRGAIAYEPIGWRADWVVCTHDHDDHSAVEGLPGDPECLVGEGRGGPFRIRRFAYDHDEYGGARFGGSVDVVRIDVDGHAIVHASDIGQSPDGPLPEPLRGVDVALVPVGGFYTAGAGQAFEWVRRLRPRGVVPIHYGTAGTNLGLQGIATFLAYVSEVLEIGRSVLRLPDDIPDERRTALVVEPSRVPAD